MNRNSFIFLLFTSLMISACAAAPREVAPAQNSTGSQAASTPQTSSPIAVGHGSSAPASTNAAVPSAAQSSASGAVKWTPPARWQTGPEKTMRAATYLIPAAGGDSEGAECAVFKDIGGGVDANIKRWIGQFEQPDGSSSESKAKRNKETINGFQVTTVDLIGAFAGMGQPAAKKANYRLLGAIVETPQGEVFFKLTGPVKTMAAAQSEFQSLLKSLK